MPKQINFSQQGAKKVPQQHEIVTSPFNYLSHSEWRKSTMTRTYLKSVTNQPVKKNLLIPFQPCKLFSLFYTNLPPCSSQWCKPQKNQLICKGHRQILNITLPVVRRRIARWHRANLLVFYGYHASLKLRYNCRKNLSSFTSLHKSNHWLIRKRCYSWISLSSLKVNSSKFCSPVTILLLSRRKYRAAAVRRHQCLFLLRP